MVPAPALKDAFWDCQMEPQQADPGRPKTSQRGFLELGLGPFNPPAQASQETLFIIPSAGDPFKG